MDIRIFNSGVAVAELRLNGKSPMIRLFNFMGRVFDGWKDLDVSQKTYLETAYHVRIDDICLLLDEYAGSFRVGERKTETTIGEYAVIEDLSGLSIPSLSQDGFAYWAQYGRKFPLDVITLFDEIVGFVVTSRENIVVCAIDGCALPLLTQWGSGVSPSDAGTSPVVTEMVTMADGVRLSTDVWLPSTPGLFPVILVRTPYGKRGRIEQYFPYICRGYAVVIQDVRGLYESEGVFVPFVNEGEDGRQTLDWIAEQPWSDGRIGMMGGSYLGYVQWAAAAAGSRKLSAICSIVPAGSAFVDMPRRGGSFVSGTLAWNLSFADRDFNPAYMNRDDWEEVQNHRPIGDIPQFALGKDLPFWKEMVGHETEDAYWRKANWHLNMKEFSIPALVYSGWYDDNGMGSTEAIDLLNQYNCRDKLVILGPWQHSGNSLRTLGGVRLASNALRYDVDYLFLMWFDRYLKGMSNRLADIRPVLYYTVGKDEWSGAATWPPRGTESTLYLSRDGGLSDEPPGVAGTDSFVYDPDNPVPHLIDVSENEMGLPGDYGAILQRDDILKYATGALKDDLTIAGDLCCRIFVSSSAADTDFVVKLLDCHPDGRSIKVADGMLRAKFRQGYSSEAFLKPGEVAELRIRTSKFAYTFVRGHRLQLAVTSSAKNLLFPNPNTGAPLSEYADAVTAVQTIHYGAGYPSRLVFNVVRNQ